MEVTQELLHELFEYKNGELYWKISPSNNVKIGDKAGCLSSTGYLFVGIKNKLYRCHRLIFLMHHGHLPKYIDHINNNPSDNRIENLRVCTIQQNQFNSKIPKNNSSGYKGIFWIEACKKWRVRIRVNGKLKSFGYFDALELAALVAHEARLKYHGEFANHGKTNEKVST